MMSKEQGFVIFHFSTVIFSWQLGPNQHWNCWRRQIWYMTSNTITYIYIYIYIYILYVYIMYICGHIYTYIYGQKWSKTHRVLKSHRSKMNVIYMYMKSWKGCDLPVITKMDFVATHTLGHMMDTSAVHHVP